MSSSSHPTGDRVLSCKRHPREKPRDTWYQRGLLKDKGRSCFLSGANAAITGDMLTTAGISIETDKKMAEELGYKIILTED